MLRYFFTMIIFASIASCKKDKIDLDVNGTWELMSISSMAGYNTYPPGNGHLLILQSGGYLEMREPGESPEIGHYSLSKNSNYCDIGPGREDYIIISFHLQGASYENFISLNNDTLNLSGDVCVSDGAYLVYRRI
jgi:hypothetical protein